MIKKIIVIILALAAVTVAVISYSRYYARKDVPLMMTEARLTASLKTALALNRHLNGTDLDVSVSEGTVTLSAHRHGPYTDVVASTDRLRTSRLDYEIQKFLNLLPYEPGDRGGLPSEGVS